MKFINWLNTKGSKKEEIFKTLIVYGIILFSVIGAGIAF